MWKEVKLHHLVCPSLFQPFAQPAPTTTFERPPHPLSALAAARGITVGSTHTDAPRHAGWQNSEKSVTYTCISLISLV